MNMLGQVERRRQKGYSLIEMLVVIAIIGMISLVTVPNFIVYARQARLKTSLRTMTNEIRWVRQLAITKNARTKLSFDTGTSPADAFRTYTIFEELTHPTTGGKSWSQIKTGQLDPFVYFFATNFPDEAAPNNDDLNDVIFQPNGTIGNMPVAGGLLRMRTDQKIAKKVFTIRFSITGQFKTEAS